MKAMRILMTSSLMLAAWASVAGAEESEKATAADPRPRVKLETTRGDIVLELNREKAPLSVENFLKYVESGYYEGTVFHRVMPSFMIQGGGYTADMKKKTKGVLAPIKNESKNGLTNKRGTIAMARMPAPHSATNQFFINVVDNGYRLDPSNRMAWGYAVFGEVVEGMDVVDEIRHAKLVVHANDPGQGREGPVNPDPAVVIKKAGILVAKPAPEKADADKSKPGESEDEAVPSSETDGE